MASWAGKNKVRLGWERPQPYGLHKVHQSKRELGQERIVGCSCSSAHLPVPLQFASSRRFLALILPRLPPRGPASGGRRHTSWGPDGRSRRGGNSQGPPDRKGLPGLRMPRLRHFRTTLARIFSLPRGLPLKTLRVEHILRERPLLPPVAEQSALALHF